MEDEYKEDEYRAITKKFEEVYRPLQDKYKLRYHMSFSTYKDGLIEIWEYHGEIQGQCICRVSEKESIDCYKMAIVYLEDYARRKREQEHGTSTDMAS